MKKIKNYYTSTSVIGKKIGDGLLSAGGTLTAYAIVEEMKTLALVALVVTIVGKFITNLFAKQ